jgi:YD repeat-containing protein
MISSVRSSILLLTICLNLVQIVSAQAATWTNTYDVMDRLSGRTDPLGRSEKYAYDLVGNLTRFPA